MSVNPSTPEEALESEAIKLNEAFQQQLDVMLHRATSRLLALENRLEQVDTRLGSLNVSADKLAQARRNATELRQQLSFAKRDMHLAESLHRDLTTPS